MPLFGHKHRDNATSKAGKNDNAGLDNSGETGGGRKRLQKNQAPQHDPHYPSPNAPVADDRGHGAGYGQHEHGMGMGGGAGAGAGQQRGSNNNDMNMNDGQTGYGSGGAAGSTGGGAPHQGMAPQSDATGDPAQPRAGGGGSRITGKVETAVGTMFGSESLKQKGLEKEQESQALKVQAADISEAERLEQAALSRRERAVAHGAHPDYKHLGGQNPGAGPTNVNEMGGGANTGTGGVGGAGSGARGGY